MIFIKSVDEEEAQPDEEEAQSEVSETN